MIAYIIFFAIIAIVLCSCAAFKVGVWVTEYKKGTHRDKAMQYIEDNHEQLTRQQLQRDYPELIPQYNAFLN